MNWFLSSVVDEAKGRTKEDIDTIIFWLSFRSYTINFFVYAVSGWYLASFLFWEILTARILLVEIHC